MATVYLANDIKHDRQVAIKVLNLDLSQTLQGERFLREIAIAARLNHPHIVPLFDSGQADEYLYYVMPYVEGESLRDRLSRKKQLPVDEALRVSRQVAAALKHAHAQGVIHRDIKPENILLSDGEAVVADFGIARAIAEAGSQQITISGLAVGTPLYMSPEQASAKQGVDERTDIYSLGCVLYEMLAGEPPFTGATAQAVIARHLSEPARSVRIVRPQVPEQIDEVIKTALAKAPADRFATAEELASSLQTRPQVAQELFGARKAILSALVMMMVLVMAWWWNGQRSGQGPVAEGADVIAVLPFDAAGAGVEDLGDGIVALISANLDAVGAISTISPRSIFTAWRNRQGSLDLQGALGVGADLNAGSVLLGTVVAVGNEVRMAAELYGVDDRERLARADATGPNDALLEMVDTLSVRLLRDVWRSREPLPDFRLSAVSSGSIRAIRYYLRGEYHFRRAAWDSAAASLEMAVEEDSTFASAHWRLAEARAWTTYLGSAEERTPLEAAYRNRERLPSHDRVLVVARVMDMQGDITAIDSLQAYVGQHPYDAEGWFLLADLMVHGMPVTAQSWEDIWSAFDRALELSPSMSRAIIHPLHLSALAGDEQRYEDYLRKLAPLSREADQFAVWKDALWGAEGASESALARALAIPPTGTNTPLVDAVLQSATLGPEPVVRAFETAAAQVPAGTRERVAFETQRVKALTAFGRVAETLRPSEQISLVDPDLAATLAIETSIATGSRSPFLDEGLAHLAGRAEEDPLAGLWLAWWEMSRGDYPAATERAQAALQRAQAESSEAGQTLAKATIDWLAGAETGTGGRLDQLEIALRGVGYPPRDAGRPPPGPGPLWYVWERTAVEHPRHRLYAIERLKYSRAAGQYTTARLLLLGSALEISGDTIPAADVYRRAVRLLSTADDDVRRRFVPVEEALSRPTEPGSRYSPPHAPRPSLRTGPADAQITSPDVVGVYVIEVRGEERTHLRTR
jgi:serine/threonine-protein kinase